MKRLLLLGCACFCLGGCATTATSTDQGLYALAAGLDTAEQVASIYEQSPAANPAIVARIKDLDATAYAVIGPLAASGGSASESDLAAAQAALAALTAYLAQNGVK